MFKKYTHENLKHTAIKHLAKIKKKYSHFQTITTNNSKHVSDFISNNTDSFMELLPNNATHFHRHQTILTFSESYWQTILHTFPEFISSNTDIFRVPSKLKYSKNFFQSTYHTIMTLSESYCQTILTYSEFISNNIHTFTELLPNKFLRV